MIILFPLLVGFFCTAIADAFWTIYTKMVTKDRGLVAALSSAVLVAIGCIDMFVFIRMPVWNAVGSILGAFTGTYLTMKYLPNEI